MQGEAAGPAHEGSPACDAKKLGFYSDSSEDSLQDHSKGRSIIKFTGLQDHPSCNEEAGLASPQKRRQGDQVPGKSK